MTTLIILFSATIEFGVSIKNIVVLVTCHVAPSITLPLSKGQFKLQ